MLIVGVMKSGGAVKKTRRIIAVEKLFPARVAGERAAGCERTDRQILPKMGQIERAKRVKKGGRRLLEQTNRKITF